MNPLLKAALVRTFSFLLWVLLSAWLFVTVENTGKDNKEEKYQLLLSLHYSMASKYNMSLDEFNTFSRIAYEALSEPEPEWTYHTAINFVIQTVTTIGYGVITPQTRTGQMMCIFVCFLGIPITLLALKSVGEVIAKWVNTIVNKIEKKILKRPEPKQKQTKSAVILFSFMVVLIVVSALSIRDRHWSFAEGVYFWFITFTTVGFGDYVLRKSDRIEKLTVNSSSKQDSKNRSSDGMPETRFSIFMDILTVCYLVVALCIVSSVLNAIVAAMEEGKCHPRCHSCISRRENKPDPKDREEKEQNNIPEERELGVSYSSAKDFGFTKDDTNTTPL